MPPATGSRKRYMLLKSLAILSSPALKPCSSSSLAVVVHSILILRKWQRMALERCQESPPKKIRNMGVHFAVSRREMKKVVWPSLWRSMAKAVGERTLKTWGFND